MTQTVRSDRESYLGPLAFESTDPILRRGFAELDEGVNIDLDPRGQRPLFQGGALFRNATFAGEPRTITLEARVHGAGPWVADPPATQLTVTLSTLYVRYQQTLALQQQAGDNPFVEPVPLHSNVEGGHGVFAGYAEHAVVVEGLQAAPLANAFRQEHGGHLGTLRGPQWLV